MLTDQVKTLCRMRSVEHQVATMHNLVGFDSGEIFEHRVERGEIAVDVRNDRQLHSYLIASNNVPHRRHLYCSVIAWVPKSEMTSASRALQCGHRGSSRG